MNYYTYTIHFVDGYYYHGMAKFRGIDPLLDKYYGSPVTHKAKWAETMFWKEITGSFDTLEEANSFEREEINKCYKADPFCLNANSGGYVLEECIRKSHETLRQRGAYFYDPEWQAKNQEFQKSNQIGIYSPGARSRGSANQPKEIKSATGKRVGNQARENKTGVCGLSDDERRVFGSLGAVVQHSQRWMNLDENYEPFVSTPCGLSRWQKARGIDTSLRVRIA